MLTRVKHAGFGQGLLLQPIKLITIRHKRKNSEISKKKVFQKFQNFLKKLITITFVQNFFNVLNLEAGILSVQCAITIMTIVVGADWQAG